MVSRRVEQGENKSGREASAMADLDNQKENQAHVLRILLIGAHSYIGKKLQEEAQQTQQALPIQQAPQTPPIQQTPQTGEQMLKKTDAPVIMESVSASDGAWQDYPFEGYDTVVLLAALVHHSGAAREMYWSVNCDMAVQIARKAKKAGVRQFVFFSTMAVYGSRAVQINSDTLPAPDTDYGKSKYQAELLLGELTNQDFILTILRPPMVYGPDCPGNYRKLQKAARILRVVPDTGNRRSMIEAGELCRQTLQLIRQRKGGIYLPQDAAWKNTAELITEMRKREGKRTCQTKAFNWLLVPLSKRIRVLGKIFGSLYYEQER